MRYGTVVQYFAEKGFGFIRPDVGADVFFHITSLIGSEPPETIEPGQAVKYELDLDTESRPGRQTQQATVGAKPQPSVRRRAKLVELIDKIPGGSLDKGGTGQHPVHHPRARQKKPNWRR